MIADEHSDEAKFRARLAGWQVPEPDDAPAYVVPPSGAWKRALELEAQRYRRN